MRAADADIDHIGDFAAVAATERPVAHAAGKFAHAGQRVLNLRHDIGAVDDNRHDVAQCRVQRRAVFARVDFLAAEQALDFGAHAALAGERHEQLHGFGGDEVLRVIEQHVAQAQREIGEPLRIAREQLRQTHVREFIAMRFQRQPCV